MSTKIAHDAGCTHTNKKHKQSGRCRKGCPCARAARKLQRKDRAK
jgi:hypothetical protein